jgi:heme exporter protein CcmD
MGMNTDPWPYIWTCYVLGSILIFGSLIWVVWHQRKLEKLMQMLEKES